MKWLNGYRNRLVLTGALTVIVLSVVNAWGAGFLDDFNRPDGEVGNGWAIWTDGGIEPKIVDNEVLIAGQQVRNWRRSGIYRLVEAETRFSFDFKADDRFNVHIELNDNIYINDSAFPTHVIDVYAWPGGPFSYGFRIFGAWSGWTEIPGSNVIAGQYNTLMVELEDTEFILTLNGQVIGSVPHNNFTRIGEVFIGSDAAAGTVGSLHIDNVKMDKAPIIPIVDFNGDGIVDLKDFSELAQYWGQNESSVDIGPTPLGDGTVDIQDLAVLADYWLKEILPPELVVYWKLDETQGDIAYDSAGNNNSILNGNPLWQPAGGKVNGALEFDGNDDYVSTPFVLNPVAGAFSIFAWVKGGNPGQVIISQQNGVNWLATDPFNFGWLITDLQATGGGSLFSQAVITDADWHRVGLTWDGKNRILYVDDVEVAKDTQGTLAGSTGGLCIGAGKNLEAGSFWSGLIDDVRIYDRAIKP